MSESEPRQKPGREYRKTGLFTLRRQLIELAARSKIMLDSVDNWILGQPTLVNSRKRTIMSVVQQRQTIADGLTRIMKDLGIERRAREVTLNDYIQQQYSEQNSGKSRSNVYANKTAPDIPESVPVEKKDSDA